MAETELRRVIATVQTCLGNSNKTAIIEIRNSAVLKVVRTLENRQFITTKNVKNFKYSLKVTKSLSDISAVREQTVKSKDVLKFGKNVLPSVTGIVILSTSKGIMCHEEAHRNSVGGKVLLIAF